MIIPSHRKIIKLAAGGTVPNPIGGVGIQYVSSAPSIPNLDAAKYFDESRRRSDAYLEAERNKLNPNQQAINDLILKAPGTAGQKAALSEEIYSAVKSYQENARKNPDWVFTDEGRDALTGVDKIISPSRFQAMQDSQRQLQTAYDSAYRNNTLNQFHIRDGRISVVDKDGNRKDVTLKEFQDDQSSESTLKPIRVSEAYDLAFNQKNFDLSEHRVYGDMLNPDQAKQELTSYFNNLGASENSNGIVSHKNNAYQRSQAKKQAINSLSSNAKDALRSEYIERTGQYSDSGFSDYLNSIIDTESEKRSISSSDIDLRAAAAAAQKQGGEGIMASEIKVDSNYSVDTDKVPGGIANPYNWIWGKRDKVDLHMGSVSSFETDKSIKPLAVNGEVMVFGDTSPFGGIKTSEDNGGKAQKLVKTFTNTSHVNNATFAVTTGEILKRQKGGEYKSVNGGDGGRVIMKGESYEDGIPRDAKIKQANTDYGKPYIYFENKDGDQVIVQMKAFKVYDVYGNIDKDDTELKKELQVLVPMNRHDAIATLGKNYSGEHHNENHYYGPNNEILTEDAKNLLKGVLEQAPQQEADFVSKAIRMVQDNPTWENKSRLNKIINHYLDQIDDLLIEDQLIKPKEEYTIKNAADNRNVQ